MLFLLTSDIHGSGPALDALLCHYDRLGCDQLIILGDILNYGPRNRIPEGIDAPGIVERLNTRADSIIAVRGNCDSEVDQMLLDFDLMATYAILAVGDPATGHTRRYFLTHGHRYHADAMPRGHYDAIFHGHTHLQGFSRADDGTLIVNTGSPTFPKGGNPPTFATLTDTGIIRIYHLDGTLLAEKTLECE